jgi:hypothetical protein
MPILMIPCCCGWWLLGASNRYLPVRDESARGSRIISEYLCSLKEVDET